MSSPLVVADTPLVEVLAAIRARLDAGETSVVLHALDPDLGRGHYAGERLRIGDCDYLHRPLRAWLDLADRLELRLATPRAVDPPLVELRLERLGRGSALPGRGQRTEKYGITSEFQRVRKHEEADFVLDLRDALARVGLDEIERPRILSLGVNAGDELALLCRLMPRLAKVGEFVGVDHSASALAAARDRFAGPEHPADFHFVEADLNALASLELGRFDLALCLGTAQSPDIDRNALMRTLVKHSLGREGALILGVPNCRYRDGELLHGGRMKNFSQPELGLVVKDLAFFRRYLQQHGREVFVTGKHELLVTAIPRAGRGRVPR